MTDLEFQLRGEISDLRATINGLRAELKQREEAYNELQGMFEDCQRKLSEALKREKKAEKVIAEKRKDTQIQRISDSKIWDFCSKTSHEWWQVAMNKWNTLSDEEQKKYNQFIGFNDFSDYLMNIMAGALMRLRDTGKLDYEEGSLLLEKQKQKPFDVGNSNNVSMI